jgi:predicted Zn-dependent protease
VVGLALGDGGLANRRGDYGRATDLLLPLRDDFRCIGGSHAQRDLFTKLLIDSAMRSGRADAARELLRERLTARPNNGWAKMMAGHVP